MLHPYLWWFLFYFLNIVHVCSHVLWRGYGVRGNLQKSVLIYCMDFRN